MIKQNVQRIFQAAYDQAKAEHHEYFTVAHALLALLSHDPITSSALDALDCDRERLINAVESHIESTIPIAEREDVPFVTDAFQKMISKVKANAAAAEKDDFSGLHILIVMIEDTESWTRYFLNKHNLTSLALMEYISVHEDEIFANDDESYKHNNESYKRIESDEEDDIEEDSALAKFATNLNHQAILGLIDPLIGRTHELERVIQVLARRRKNNPILVGEAGVGKTAIAEGLANKIVDDDVPAILKDFVIYSVDLSAMLAGSKYRGDFEQRLKDLMSELEATENAIIFIDEIHTLLGAGATTDSSMDASNMLKPALSSGKLRCIGATTYKEYKSSFEKNHALARRFQKIEVQATSVEETIDILHGLKSRFEEYHNVRYSDEAIESAVVLSDKYIHDRHLPDKAIDLIDEAGAFSQVNYMRRRTLKAKDIESVVAKIARVPEQTVSQDDRKSLRYLARNLKRTIFGQNKAIDSLSSAVKLSRAGLNDSEKPVGSFLFVGPTGVGKTEVSKQLAAEMGIEFVRFDMSEYMEAHTVSRLIGAPPGYVGFDQGGLLTEAISKHPHSVLLLDELEKAHPNIYNILLQIMDYGRLTDTNGKVTHFSNVVLIMTSNVGAEFSEKTNIGFADSLDAGDIASENAFKKTFSPEFRNRLTEIIRFKHLDEKAITRVIDRQVSRLSKLLDGKSVSLLVTAPAKHWLLKHGYNKIMGARPMSRLIEREIARPLSDLLLFSDLKRGGSVTVTRENDKLALTVGNNDSSAAKQAEKNEAKS